MAGLQSVLSVVTSLLVLALIGIGIYAVIEYGKKVKSTYESVEKAAAVINELGPKFESIVEDIHAAKENIACVTQEVCKEAPSIPIVGKYIEKVCKSGFQGCVVPLTPSTNAPVPLTPSANSDAAQHESAIPESSYGNRYAATPLATSRASVARGTPLPAWAR